MASAVASLVLGRAVCRSFPSLTPMCRPRCLSRLTSSCVSLMGLISRTPVRPCPAISVRHASSSTSKAVSPEDMIKRADKNLLNVLENEIKRADGSWATQQELALPDDSPFEIVDNPLDQSFTLKRELQGETIEVSVFMNLDKDGDEGKNSSGDAQPSVSLLVTIDNGHGPDLKFMCSMDSKRIVIESMKLWRPGQVDYAEAYKWIFSNLDFEVQMRLDKYLVVRGINPSLYDFLRYYMMNKNVRDYVIWLKKLREFVTR